MQISALEGWGKIWFIFQLISVERIVILQFIFEVLKSLSEIIVKRGEAQFLLHIFVDE